MVPYILALRNLETATGDHFEGSLGRDLCSLVVEVWRKTIP